MKRQKIEQITVSISVLLLFMMTLVGITFFFFFFFGWDLFTPQTEKILGFFMLSGLVLIISSTLVNVMINLSIIAINSEKFLSKPKKDHE